nr:MULTISPECIES: hypothetical protein [unclassified Neglectibacter]
MGQNIQQSFIQFAYLRVDGEPPGFFLLLHQKARYGFCQGHHPGVIGQARGQGAQ